MTPAHLLTVQDVLRQALPIGTRIVAGREGLSRTVAWPSVLQTRAPAFPDLEGRELALLSLDALHLVSDKLTLVGLITELADAEVAAIGVIGPIDDHSADVADARGIPLLSMPVTAVLRQVERDVARALVDSA